MDRNVIHTSGCADMTSPSLLTFITTLEKACKQRKMMKKIKFNHSGNIVNIL